MKISALIKTESRYPVNRHRIRETVNQFLTSAGLVDCEVSLAFVGKRKLKQLAQQYLGSNEEHVVLAFPLETEGREPFVTPPEGKLLLGEIIISYPQTLRWAKAKNTRVDDIIDQLVTYGLGHLLGANPKWQEY